VALDSYHDRRTAFSFGVNPLGVKRDALLYEDTRTDPSWDAVWDAAAGGEGNAWTAEFRIPFSQLRFGSAEANGEQVWGINVQRTLARRGEVSNWARIRRDVDRRVSLFGELHGLREIAQPYHFELQPYSVARLTHAPRQNDNPFSSTSELIGTLGADVKYAITSNLTFTATVNPDFGQVEADPSVVRATGYEEEIPEKRPFFLEGTQIFRQGVGDADLFYSRRIGRTPQRDIRIPGGFADIPDRTTILGAAKLSGKIGKRWSVGFLEAMTADEYAPVVDASGFRQRELVEPKTNYTVQRVQRIASDGQSAVGGILTTTHRSLGDRPELGFLRSSAYVAGSDLWRRFGEGRYEWTGSILASRVSGSPPAIRLAQTAPGRFFQRPDAEHLRLDSTRTSMTGVALQASVASVAGALNWRVGGSAISPGFEVNDLGFQRESDLLSQYASLFVQQLRENRIFRYSRLSANQWTKWSFGREHLGTAVSAEATAQLKSFWGVGLGGERSLSALSTTALYGGPALRMPATTRVWLSGYTDPRKSFSASFYAFQSEADELGGVRKGVYPSLNMRPTSRLNLGLEPGLTWVSDWELASIAQAGSGYVYVYGKMDVPILSLTTRVNYTLSPTLSFQLYAQPYVNAREFVDLREVVDPRAEDPEQRLRSYLPGELSWEPASGTYSVDRNFDHRPEYRFQPYTFNFKEFRSNAVLRWEYNPGSTLFVVWTQERYEQGRDGSLDLERDFGRLVGAPGRNVLLVKVSYWLGM
jgi:hypothetical protein